MSNHLAFANVTAALRDLLDAAAKKAVSGASATAERPDTLKDDTPRVNVFLYQVTPNAAWRNADLPTRRPDGTVGQRPRAAFDLHYVLSFYGSDKQHEPQRILGSVVSVLHAQPVLSPEILEGAAKDTLAASDLARQVEPVRLTPTGFNLEELSKLWSVFFQVPYKLSVAYQASVALIEPEITTQPALPVRSRNLYVFPFQQPEIDEVVAAAGPGLAILPGDTVVLRGRNLRGEATRVRIGDQEVEPAPADVSSSEIRVPLTAPPFPADALRAGVVGAQVVHLRMMGTPATLHAGTGSNAAPFVLRPRIKTVGPDPDVTISTPPVDGVRTVTVGIEPRVGTEQRVVLLLNEPVPANPQAFSALAERRENDTDPVVFHVRGLTAGTVLLVRVQVDGAESPLDVVGGAYAGPKVTVP
ncbi:MAG TPA: DUF4255 domain-containing protein [Thermoanaerobaculia bacterium]|nr:DUF4255 domain-containing protein [Thermoanaerobaculia bacterium]